MKKFFFIQNIVGAAALAVSLTAVSCSEYLELTPKSSFGPETIFGTVENAKKAVLAAYQRLGGDQTYGSRINLYFPYDEDSMMGLSGTGDNGRRDLNRYNITASNTQLYFPFEWLYTGVERSNICIKYIPEMDLYKNGSDLEKAKLRRLYGEALTLRAQYVFDLIKLWGDLPIQWRPSAEEPDLFLPKMDRDSIYDRILDDLALAKTLVPWRSELTKIGEVIDERITKGAVMALRARIALFRGGYSLRRGSNRMERGSNHLHYYQIAADECRALIASNEHKLAPTFLALFKDHLNAHLLDPWGEVIFDVAQGGSGAFTDSKVGYFSGLRDQIRALPTFFYDFHPADTRRDVTIAPYVMDANGVLTAREITRLNDGKWRLDWITNPSFPYTATIQYMGINWPLIRYSDVLLMFAEAENELNNGPTAAAIDAFEQVRKRAFAGNEHLIGPTPTSKEGFFEAIVDERALEFAGEAIRKYDLIRWNLLAAKLAEAREEMAKMAAREAPYDKLPRVMYYYPSTAGGNGINWASSFYEPEPLTPPVGALSVEWVTPGVSTNYNWTNYAEGFRENHSELLPIPQDALNANPKLTQDYGY